MNKTGTLDKSNYVKKDTIGVEVRKATDQYFKSVAKGKDTPGKTVKKVYTVKG